jgi:hypothetical protein
MTSANVVAEHVGIELFHVDGAVDSVATPSEAYVDVGKHSAPRRDGMARRVTVMGEAAVRVSGQIIGKTVAELVSSVITEVDGRQQDGQPSTLEMSSLQLTFGVKIVAGAGNAIEAFVTANGETSVQVVATFTRPVETGDATGRPPRS